MKSENLSLTFLRNVLLKPPLPAVGGDEGKGEPKGLYFVHPHPHPPPCLRRSGFAQAGIEGGGKILNVLGQIL